MKKRVKKLYLQEKKRSLKKIFGTQEKPRLSVFRSHQHIYGQLIDDRNGKTISACSTVEKEICSKIEKTSNQEAAFLVGKELAKRALGKEITSVVFDRGRRPYHGRIKNLAEGARQEGLIF
jgi:large subunit ribosomal protein L18